MERLVALAFGTTPHPDNINPKATSVPVGAPLNVRPHRGPYIDIGYDVRIDFNVILNQLTENDDENDEEDNDEEHEGDEEL
ncbi:hypothetical protein RhiirA4_463467 [Rhizophagus irregularis]|uniref:Uncharacterized protein n=1 Tax=Rhizophagus irregularis TaxID=588596 RepID=A0A2I1GN07_9GLOM|nr:hypothetical protein RhiirA4_463467 [Rhizophagus irregularis]